MNFDSIKSKAQGAMKSVDVGNIGKELKGMNFEIPKGVLDDGNYFIIHAASGKAVDFDNPTGKSLHIWNHSTSNKNQLLEIKLVEEDTYIIKHHSLNKVMSVESGSKRSGSRVIHEPGSETPTPAQKWKIIKVSGGNYSIKNVNSGLMFDLSGNSNANGNKFIIYQSNGTPAQIFSFKKA